MIELMKELMKKKLGGLFQGGFLATLGVPKATVVLRLQV
jgi:hypothetical protein